MDSSFYGEREVTKEDGKKKSVLNSLRKVKPLEQVLPKDVVETVDALIQEILAGEPYSTSKDRFFRTFDEAFNISSIEGVTSHHFHTWFNKRLQKAKHDV